MQDEYPTEHPSQPFLDRLQERVDEARRGGFCRGWDAANKRAVPYIIGIGIFSAIAGSIATYLVLK